MAVRKRLITFILCIVLVMTFLPPVAFATGETAVSEPIVFTKAAIELRDDTYQVVIEGQISSFAAYQNIVYEIKNTAGATVFLCQDTTRMQGFFSLQAAWENLIPDQDYTLTVATKDATASCEIDNDFYKNVYCSILQKIDTLNQRIASCKDAGLTETAYEELAVGVAEYTLPYLNQAYLDGDTDICNHQGEELFRILAEADANAQGYLNQTRIQRPIEPYEVGDIVAEDGVLYTQTEDGKKATFLTGYHIFGSEKPDMAKLKAMGINHLTLEVSLGQCQENPGTVFIVPYGFMGPWEMDGSLYLICPEDTIVADGRGAVRLVSKGPDIAISTDVPLKANKTYEVGVSVLAGSNGYLQIGTEKVNFSASNDWQTIQTTITSHADQARGIAVRTSGATDGIYVDNLYVKEVGTQENLVVNGDFERGKIIRSQYGDFCFTVDTGWLETIRAWATEAGSYGMTCCVSLTPHYMPGHVETISYGVSDTGYNHNGFMIYNPTDDVYNELLRAMYDAAAEILGDCEAVSQFMLANEPSFTASESPYYLPKWQGFLREKYGTVGAVNDAWNTAYTSFEHIFMPEEVSLTPLYQDYREFNDGLLTQAFAWQAAYLKEKTPHIETVVKTLQSNNYINKQFKNANDYENWAEFFDINGCDTMAYYNEDENSLSIRGMWLDYISSIKNAPIVDLEMHSLRSGVFTHTDAIIPPWVETTLWHGAMHGVYLTVPWLLDNGTWADFSNTILVNRPECLKVIGEMNYDLNRLAKEIGILQSKKAEIAMYYSRENRDALADNPKIMGKVYDIVVKNGEKVDFVTESNPQALNSGQYQLLVMADIKVLSAEMLEEIKRFTEQGGQVVLVYSELSKNELLSLDTDGKAQNAQTLKKVKDVATILQDSYVSSSLKEKIFVATDKNVRLVDANGNDITDCEWSYTTYGMEYLVSITNHNPDNSVTAYLEIDGERVSDFTELRTLTDYEDSITLSSYQPVLLRTNFVKDTLEVTVSGQTVGATASVVPTDKLDKAMLILALYKDNALIDVKLEYVDATKSECTTRIEKELLEQGNYRVTRFFFDQELNPLLEKEERRFKIQ